MFDPNNTSNYEYYLYLCNIDKTIICAIDYIDIQYEQNFLQYDQLSFTIPLVDMGWKRIENQFFNYFQPLYLILMEVKNEDTLIFKEYFIVNSPTFSEDDGVVKKNIKCYSSDYMFNNYYLNSYEDVKLLYDTVGNNGILNTMLDQMENTWTVNYISPTLLNVYHSYNFSSSTFRSIIETLQEQFNVFFIFDTVLDQINIYDASSESYGESTDIIISDENFLKSLSADIKGGEMVTKLRVSGKNNISISKYNPTGMFYLLDYSWAQDNGRMSQSLSDAYDAWKQLILDNETAFQNYLNALTVLETNLLTAENDLNDLNSALIVIDDSLDLLIDTNRRNTSAYDTIYLNKVSVLGEISTKEGTITTLEGQIDDINDDILTLNTLLSIDSNFTLTQRKKLSRLTVEGTLKLDTVSNEYQLYTYAKAYQLIKNKPSIDTTLNIVDLFSITDSYIEDKYDKIKVGNYIYLDCSSLGFNYEQYRITQISHSKLSNSLSFTISNKDRLNTEIYYLNRIFVPSSEAASTLKTNKEDYSKYTQESNTILYNYSHIDVSTNEIIIGDNTITKRGFLGNSLGTRNGAIKIQGDQIVFSPDGNFQSYYAILSSDGLYLETSDVKSRTVITPQYGIQIDQNVGTVGTPNWDNIFYVDSSDGSVHLDGGYIECITSDNLNRIKIDPTTGISIAVWDSVSGIWDDRFYVSSNTLIHRGLFTTGKIGEARIEIDDNGLISYNTSNQKHGLEINPGSFVDLIINRSGSEIFKIYDDITAIDLYALGHRFLSSSNSVAVPYSSWDCSYASFLYLTNGVSNYATEAWVTTNFAPISHSHSYATSSDISSAIAAHELAYH
jgi:hypothetical protein